MKGMFRTEEDGKTHYYLDGKEVTEKRFFRAFRPAPGGRAGDSLVGWKRAIHSESLAVNPAQILEASEYDRQNGVPTEYDQEGRPKFNDRDHRRRYMVLHGAFDRDGGYGDAQQGATRAAREQWGQEDLPDYSHLTEGAFKEAVDYRRTLG